MLKQLLAAQPSGPTHPKQLNNLRFIRTRVDGTCSAPREETLIIHMSVFYGYIVLPCTHRGIEAGSRSIAARSAVLLSVQPRVGNGTQARQHHDAQRLSTLLQ